MFAAQVRQKNLARRGPSAQIAKPIRAGQHHINMGATGGIRTGGPVPILSGGGSRIIADPEERKRRGIMAGGNRGDSLMD